MLHPPKSPSNTEETGKILRNTVLEENTDVPHDASNSEVNTEGNPKTTQLNHGAIERNDRGLHLNDRQRDPHSPFAGLPHFSYSDLIVALNRYTEVFGSCEGVIDYSALGNAWDYAIYYGSKPVAIPSGFRALALTLEVYHTGEWTTSNALRNELKQFLQRVRGHSNDIMHLNLPLWRSLLELFYVYLLLSLIVDILRIVSRSLGEYEDIISLAMDARYVQLNRWDFLIATLGPVHQVIEESANRDSVSLPQDLHEHVQNATKILRRFGTLHLVFSQKWYLESPGAWSHVF